jgi:hypothetical protein
MSREDEASREAILARRRRFLALALSGVTTASTATACACLTPAFDGGPRDAGIDAEDASERTDGGSTPTDGGEPVDGGEDAP